MPDYIDIPVETDPDVLAGFVFDDLQAEFPGWTPAAGNLEVILSEAYARVAAEIRDLASRVPTSVFRYFGARLMNILPKDAAAASVSTSWIVRDLQGYTIPAGTAIGVPASGDSLMAFVTLSDTVIPPGQNTVYDVIVQAVTPGATSSGLGGVGAGATLVTTLDYVTMVTLDAPTAGGQDAETDTEYLNRLVADLQLLSPRPILAPDFAALSKNVEGVHRAVALDNYYPGNNEIQQIAIVSATGGTFTLTFSGQTTAGIAYNASAAAIQTALEALSNINPGDVVVTGTPFTWQVQFTGQYTNTNVAQMTANGASLTGGGASISVSTTVAGVPSSYGNERMVTIVAIDSLGEGVGPATKAEIDAYLQAMREQNFLVYVINPTYITINVTFTFVARPGYVLTDVETRAEAAVTEYLKPSNWGIPQTGHSSDLTGWENVTKVRYLEVAEVINRVDGVAYIDTGGLTIGVEGGSLGTTDITLVGAAPLPRPGVVAGTAI